MASLLGRPELALFVALPNGCYRQLTGTSVYDLQPSEGGYEVGGKRSQEVERVGDAGVDTQAADDLTAVGQRARVAASALKRCATTACDSLTTLPELEASFMAGLPAKIATPALPPAKRRRLLGSSASVPTLTLPTSAQLEPPTGAQSSRLLSRSHSSGSVFTPASGIASALSKATLAEAPLKVPVALLKPSEVLFVRHRMHHAGPDQDKHRRISYGFSRKREHA